MKLWGVLKKQKGLVGVVCLAFSSIEFPDFVSQNVFGKA